MEDRSAKVCDVAFQMLLAVTIAYGQNVDHEKLRQAGLDEYARGKIDRAEILSATR